MFHVHPKPKEALEICLLRMLAFNPLNESNQDFSESSGIEICMFSLSNAVGILVLEIFAVMDKWREVWLRKLRGS